MTAVYAIDISLINVVIKQPPIGVGLSLIDVPSLKEGYIAGTADGIVTVNSKTDKREILVMSATDYKWVARVWSLTSGHYLINNLDPKKQYLIMCRDLPPNGVDQRYEPAVWDYVSPATDLTVAEQQELWESWLMT